VAVRQLAARGQPGTAVAAIAGGADWAGRSGIGDQHVAAFFGVARWVWNMMSSLVGRCGPACAVAVQWASVAGAEPPPIHHGPVTDRVE